MIFKPMLAHEYHKHKKKIHYPCFVQPKLDGIRCIVEVLPSGAGVEVNLVTRNGNRIKSLPQLESYLILNLALKGHVFRHRITFLDGEITADVPFEELCSLVKRQKPITDEEFEKAKFKYTIFDVSDGYLDECDTEDRLDWLWANINDNDIISVVETFNVENEEDLDMTFKDITGMGGEGVMIRNICAGYEHKRSFGLLKRKPWKEDWFKIVGLKEGKGKLAGCLGSFVCETKDKVQFSVKPALPEHELKEIWEDYQNDNYLDCDIKVQFQEFTNKNKVPKFPIGQDIRWSEKAEDCKGVK